jgi:hypothetical protein
MTRQTRNGLLALGGLLTLGLVPWLYRRARPRPQRRPRLSTELAREAEDVTELANFRAKRRAA